MILYSVSLILLFISSITDIKNRKIPNIIIILLFITGIAVCITDSTFLPNLIGLVFPSSAMLVLYFAGKNIGAGDIKLISATGLIFGYKANLFIFFASLVLALIYLLITRLASKTKVSVPFAPFVFLSCVIFLCCSLALTYEG